MAQNKVFTLKLIIHKDIDTRKLLFAEAGKDFVDFLFKIPSLPLGNALSLLENEHKPLGSLGNLCKSIMNLDQNFIQLNTNQNKDSILLPLKPNSLQNLFIKSNQNNNYDYYYNSPSYYINTLGYVPSTPGCPNKVNNQDDQNEKYYRLPYGGYVKDTSTYIVMDDLTVEPFSTISCMALLGKLGVMDMTKLEQKNVKVGVHEGMALLKASMVTQNVLTHVFLKDDSAVEEKVDNIKKCDPQNDDLYMFI